MTSIKMAYLYALMWAYENHYHVEEARVTCHVTYDYGIASIFIQGS
jgi:hypothetical protein